MHQFYALCGIPGVVGIVDCFHVPIPAPYVREEVFVNRRQRHTLNVQV